MKNNAFVKGAIILIIFNLIGKVVGAVYRIPLAKIVGSVGMGQYQLIFPLYCLILTVSTSGIPVAISKMVAEFNGQKRFFESKRLLKISILLLSLISLIGFLIVVFGAKTIASIQGNSEIYMCYYGIAPAVLFVGVLSAFRGYFQGNLKMFPTAISGLIEQVVKLFFGLFFANKFLIYGVEYAVFGALLGVSISEFCAFLYLLVVYLFHANKKTIEKPVDCLSYKKLSRQMLSFAVPVTLGGLVAPMTSMIDSLLVVNLLIFSGFSSADATMLLGLQSGVVEPLVNIPVIVSVSIATALLPSLSSLSAANSKKQIKSHVERAFQICLSIAIACFICFIIFGEQILSFLYGNSFDFYELSIAVKLLFFGGVNIVFLSLVQVSSAVLQGLGHQKYPVKTLLVGCVIKIILDVCLILVKSLNIFGAIISAGVCYFVVLVLNYKKIKKLTGASLFSSYFDVSVQACFVCMFAYFSNLLFKMVFSEVLAMFVSGIIAVVVFAVTFYVFFVQNKNAHDDLSIEQLTWKTKKLLLKWHYEFIYKKCWIEIKFVACTNGWLHRPCV